MNAPGDDMTMLAPDPSGSAMDSRESKPSEEQEASASVRANVKLWLNRIEKAEKKFKGDFERMRDSMDFVYGLQWNGQKDINYDKYVANWTIRAVNQGVATLYARNPQVECKRDYNRLNFRIWDGKIETIQMASQLLQMGQMFGMPVPPDVIELMEDFKQGRLHEAMVDRLAKTLQYLCQSQLDRQTPDFKTQMKQLVRRVNVCGVGYIKCTFHRDDEDGYEQEISQSKTRLSMSDRMAMIKSIAEKIEKGKVEDSSSELERLQMLVISTQLHPLDAEATMKKEYTCLDFPRATSIIPDPNTRTLKGFIGAHWVAERLYFPLKFINEFYGTNIEASSDVKLHGPDNEPDEGKTSPSESPEEDAGDDKKVCIYIVRDLDTKSEFTLCKGHKDYICEPETISPCPRNFWDIFPVTFNDVEVEEGCNATIFPPSLVDLIKPAQKEWNRIRQALRRHRKANGPKYMYVDGTMGDDDLDRISNAEDQEFCKLKHVPPGTDVSKVVTPLAVAQIQKELYDAEPIREDSLLTSGQQEANQGPPQPNITATGVTVAEQSRMGVAASDIDGLDDALTAVVDCSAQLMLMEMSSDSVRQYVGRGVVWPDDPAVRRELLDEVEVKIRAGSSGKPNQAVDLNKWQTESQILMNFGANPQAVIRETITRFDDHLEPADFFPVSAPMAPAGPPQTRNGQNGKMKPRNGPGTDPRSQGRPQQMVPAGASPN